MLWPPSPHTPLHCHALTPTSPNCLVLTPTPSLPRHITATPTLLSSRGFPLPPLTRHVNVTICVEVNFPLPSFPPLTVPRREGVGASGQHLLPLVGTTAPPRQVLVCAALPLEHLGSSKGWCAGAFLRPEAVASGCG